MKTIEEQIEYVESVIDSMHRSIWPTDGYEKLSEELLMYQSILKTLYQANEDNKLIPNTDINGDQIKDTER